MSTAEIFIMSVALAVDAFAVTISNCFVYVGEKRSRLLLMPLFFGGFQALMAALGYLVGGLAAQLIETYAPWVTFIILGIVGGNMIWESLKEQEEEQACEQCHLSLTTLFLQAIATAIDAFAVGVSLRAQVVDLPFSLISIGIVTALCSLLAIALGKKIGPALGTRAETVGGVVLVLIGLKALIA